jgi:hypothetical protein
METAVVYFVLWLLSFYAAAVVIISVSSWIVFDKHRKKQNPPKEG